MSDRTKTIIGLNVAVLLAGATGLFGRFISLSGLPMVWYRIMVCVATLGCLMAATGRFHRLPKKSFIKIASCGILLALHWVAFFSSVKASNVSIGVVCIATACFFTVLFNPIVNRTKFSVAEAIIRFVTILGTVLIFSFDVRYRLGIALGLASAALYSLFAILNINVAKETGEADDTMLYYELVGGLIFLTVCIPFYAHFTSVEAVIPSGKDIVYLLILGPFFTVIPFLLQLNALRKLSAFTVNVTYNIEPIYSIILANIFFNEANELDFSFWIGLLLIVASVVIQVFRTRNVR
ncbi:MAG: DMT family transporter [Bacteroidales bacterium]|nr:DMT family transporter [Bacteroidales bacterium]